MTPAHIHIKVDWLSSAGCPPIVTVSAPGAQGPAVAGMHGMGVSTPQAADVAAATAGLANEKHAPNGRMFVRGTLHIMFASGTAVFTRSMGKTTRVPGAIPKVH